MSPATISPLANVKALTFDVFGTVVNWRRSVVDELVLRAHRKLSSDLPNEIKTRLQELTKEDWGKFAQEWRDSYGRFTESYNPDTDQWKTIDEHHRDSLADLLKEWRLEETYTESEIESLSLVWHRLEPWTDSSAGIEELGKTLTTSSLTNGNLDLVRDLNDFGGLGFKRLFSAEIFRVYKPNPKTYLGAARELGYRPEEVAMVAAHLADLAAARACGLRTIYVERPQEEEWASDSENYQKAKEWVDLWISGEEDGFLTVAQRLKELS